MKSLMRIGFILAFFAQLSWSAFSQVPIIKTVAGNGSSGFAGDGGPATAAELYNPSGVAMDTLGNVFIADSGNHRIRKVTLDGIINTVAGNGNVGFAGDGGLAPLAQLNSPSGVAMDSLGNLLVADSGNGRIRKLAPDGVIVTVAGGGKNYPGDGGQATSAVLNYPVGVVVDSMDNLFISDNGNYRIRKVTPDGVITTVAGGGSDIPGDGGRATSAKIGRPFGIAMDAAGSLLFADPDNQVIRKVTADGIISTVAGNGTWGFGGDGGPAISAQLSLPSGVAVDVAGNLFVADSNNNRIRKITPGGIINTIAGGASRDQGDGGPAASATLSYPEAVAVDPAGNLFIADLDNQRIREVVQEAPAVAFFPQIAVGDGYSTMFTIANTGTYAASVSMILTDPRASPLVVTGALTDSFGNAQPAYTGSSFDFPVPAGGTVFLSVTALNASDPTLVGWAQMNSTSGVVNAIATYERAANGLVQQAVGVVQSQLSESATIPVDNDANLAKEMAYAIANPSDLPVSIQLALVSQNGTIFDETVTVPLGPKQQIARYLWQDLPCSSFKGSLILRGQDGTSFVAVALLEKQGLFTAIPLITPASISSFAKVPVLTSVAGTEIGGFSGDGGVATSAMLSDPWGAAVDKAGNLFIADTGNSRVRKVTLGGTISTVAGNGTIGPTGGDGGPATSARIYSPRGLAVDDSGNLFIADFDDSRIRKVTPSGTISTVAGNGTHGFSGDGGPATSAQLHFPIDVAIDTAGNLFIADSNNGRIRRVSPGGVISTVAGGGVSDLGDGGPAISASLGLPFSVAVDSAGNLLIADRGSCRVRKVTPGGIISTLAGNGRYPSSGDGGPATSAQLTPQGLDLDGAGNIFIADIGGPIGSIRKVTPDGIISTVAGGGTDVLGDGGGAATSQSLYGPTGVAMHGAGNLYITEQSSNRVRMVALEASSPTFFPQIVAGRGYSTRFTINNKGTYSASGRLTLRDQQGNPLTVSGILTDSFGTTQPALDGSSFAFMVPAEGMICLSVLAAKPDDGTKVGWARLESIGGLLTGVAAYEYAVDGKIQTIVGVLQSQPMQLATIPVDNDATERKQMVYAVANPGEQGISIKLALINQGGVVINDTVTLTLSPGQQIARYLWQDFGLDNFKGSLVIRGQNGQVFIALGLSEKQGLYSVIPLISGKSSRVPD